MSTTARSAKLRKLRATPRSSIRRPSWNDRRAAAIARPGRRRLVQVDHDLAACAPEATPGTVALRPLQNERAAARLVLLTTSDLQGTRESEFLRMIVSVRAGMRTGIRVTMFVLLQRSDADAGAKYQGILPACSVILTSPERMSLSQARNTLLAAAQKSGAIDADCVVGFPDDDCWYPPRFVE